MARYLKNTQLKGGSYSIQLPLGTNSIGPDSPVDGQIRFNQTTNKIEFYYNNTWNQVAKIGTVQVVVDQMYTADGVNQYTMSQSYTAGQESSVLVFVGGVQQIPTVNYTFSGGVASNQLYLQPSTSGDANQPIIVIHNLNSTKTIGD
jgi:uncharacterized membrane protein